MQWIIKLLACEFSANCWILCYWRVHLFTQIASYGTLPNSLPTLGNERTLMRCFYLHGLYENRAYIYDNIQCLVRRKLVQVMVQSSDYKPLTKPMLTQIRMVRRLWKLGYGWAIKFRKFMFHLNISRCLTLIFLAKNVPVIILPNTYVPAPKSIRPLSIAIWHLAALRNRSQLV